MRIRLLMTAAIVAAGVAIAPAVSMPASAATCFTGHTTSVVGPAGQTPTNASVILDTADNPPGCEQVLARIFTTGGHTYRSGLIRNVGTTTATAKDGTAVAKAWEEKQPYNDPSGRRCRQFYPNVEVNFHPCTGIKQTIRAKFTALVQPLRRCTRDLKITYGQGTNGASAWENVKVIRACAHGIRADAFYYGSGISPGWHKGAWSIGGNPPNSFVSPNMQSVDQVGYDTGSTTGNVVFHCVHLC